jgi:hypothetical protein
MTHSEYLQSFLELVNQEGQYHLLEFTLIDEDEGIDVYWLTLQLPEPYERIESPVVLSGLTFDQVDFKARTLRFVVGYDDVVSSVDRCRSMLKEKPEKPAN